ncbi:MAG: formate/nitrite transporter family protein [Phycisphaerae bacterium]|jgi:formate/nitrite transporter
MAFKTSDEIVKTVCVAGHGKSLIPLNKLIVLSFLAGAYIAFGGLLAVVVGGGIPEIKAAHPGLAKLIFGSVFPLGLILVVVAGAELFTGNAACMIPGLFDGRIRWGGLAYNWSLSFIGNFIGSVFVAYFLAYMTGLLAADPWRSSIVALAEAKIKGEFWPLFFKGVGCNWLVCLAVWMAIASEDVTGKILSAWWPIMAFVTLGLEHSVANMFFVPAGMFYGAKVTWGQFLVNNLVPVTAGNIVGGALFVGLLYAYVHVPKRKNCGESE